MGSPFAGNYPEMIALCLAAFDRGGPAAPLDLLEAMMSLPGVEMHTPEHHFMVPAALLTAAHSVSGRDRAVLERALHAALNRSKRVPGGSCGDCGGGQIYFTFRMAHTSHKIPVGRCYTSFSLSEYAHISSEAGSAGRCADHAARIDESVYISQL